MEFDKKIISLLEAKILEIQTFANTCNFGRHPIINNLVKICEWFKKPTKNSDHMWMINTKKNIADFLTPSIEEIDREQKTKLFLMICEANAFCALLKADYVNNIDGPLENFFKEFFM